MKSLFKKMQKEQMKSLKAENKKSSISNKLASSKRFIANCLVKVTCSEEKCASVTVDILKVIKISPIIK